MENKTDLKVPNVKTNVCNDMSKNLEHAGAFLNEDAARKSLQRYFEQEGLDPKDPDHIYGHTFGLEKMREFIANIDTYNSTKTDEADLVKGIRVYYGVSQRHDTDFPLVPIDGYFRDVFFMPVLASGEDLYKIHDLLPDIPVLGESRPCPNECGFSFV